MSGDNNFLLDDGGGVSKNEGVNEGVGLVELFGGVSAGDNNFTTLEDEDGDTFAGVKTHRFTINPTTGGGASTDTGIRGVIDIFDINAWVGIRVIFREDMTGVKNSTEGVTINFAITIVDAINISDLDGVNGDRVRFCGFKTADNFFNRRGIKGGRGI